MLRAQHEVHSEQNPTLQLKIVVDGSKTPGEIPDELAFQHFFLSTAEDLNANSEQRERQLAKLAPLRLSLTDRDVLISHLSAFKMQMDRIEKWKAEIVLQNRSAHVGMASPAGLDDLLSQAQALVRATREKLGHNLSAAGAARVNDHVKHDVKRHITIYGN